MRLLILGNSLVIIRPLLNSSFNDIYGFILKRYFKSKGNNDVFIFGKAANHTRIQSREERLIYDLKQFEPDIVILHLGISDCAPRLITESEQFYLQSFPNFIRIKTITFLSKYRYFFTKTFQKVYVKINDFQKYYQKILTEIKKIGAIPIIINISKPNQKLINRSYNILGNVKRYNNVLSNLAKKNNCKLINIYSLIENEPILQKNDGIYLSKSGNKKLAKILIQEIESMTATNLI